jgi:hypothetical protein
MADKKKEKKEEAQEKWYHFLFNKRRFHQKATSEDNAVKLVQKGSPGATKDHIVRVADEHPWTEDDYGEWG